MSTRRIPERGDVYWIDPNPVIGREMKDKHPFVVITPKEINALGVSIVVPITSGGTFARNNGLTVAISGHKTTGVAICNQVRCFDIQNRILAGTVKYVETIDISVADEIVNRVVSIIDPLV